MEESHDAENSNEAKDNPTAQHGAPAPKKHAIAPLPPRWRFVNDAKKAHGYSTADAGRRIDGLSAEELAAKYRAPSFSPRSARRRDVEVGKLDIVESTTDDEEIIEGEFAGFGLEQESDSECGISQSLHDAGSLDEEKKEESSSDSEENISEEFIGDMSILSDRIIEEQHSIKMHDTISTPTSISENHEDFRVDASEKQSSILSSIEANTNSDKAVQLAYQNNRIYREQYKFLTAIVLLLLMCSLALALGLIYGSSPESRDNPSDNENSLENLVFLTNGTDYPSSSPSSSIILSQLLAERCSVNTKLFELQVTSQSFTESTQAQIFANDATWVVKEECSGDIVLECQPCNADAAIYNNLFDDASNAWVECLSMQKQYIFEVNESSGKESCCNFTISNFLVTYDGVVVLEGDTTNDRADNTILFGERNEPCPTTPPSRFPSLGPTMFVSEIPSIINSESPRQNPTIIQSEYPSMMPTVQPTCNINADDSNICFAIDTSGSVCNQGTGFECNWCDPALICNADGVVLSSCCNNFVDVVGFTKEMISSLATLNANQNFSVVQFSTNATVVNPLTSSYQALAVLGEMTYTGGCKYLSSL